MDSFDFCLSCEKQCAGTYCSQSCRLADLEYASPSSPSSPSTRQSWPLSTAGSAYVLAPPFNSTTRQTQQSPVVECQVQSSYFMRYPTQQSKDLAQERSLTPSSSRSSLSSVASDPRTSSHAGISQQARTELDGFFSSFSRAKAAKRRSSTR